MPIVTTERPRRRDGWLLVGALSVLVLLLVAPVVVPMVRPVRVPIGSNELVVIFTQARRVRVPIPGGLHRWPSSVPPVRQTTWTLRMGGGVYFVFWQDQQTQRILTQMKATLAR